MTNMPASTNHDDVIVERVEVPAWRRDLLLGAAHDAELLIMPMEVRDGRGVYRDADLPAVKALRAAGVNADWPHPAPARTYRSEFAAEPVTVIAMFIAQALGEHSVAEIARYVQMRALEALGRRQPGAVSPTVTFNLDRLVKNGDRLEVEGLRITGSDSKQIAKAVRSVLKGD